MDPQIQYAKTEDGVSIAYWTMGEGGTPLVIGPPLGWSHIALEWQIPELAAWYELLARNRQVVRYDVRGNGLSQRDVSDDQVTAVYGPADIEAVASTLDSPQVSLIGIGPTGPSSASFASAFPERVEHLIFWSPSISKDFETPRMKTVIGLAKEDWHLFTETWAHTLIGWAKESKRAHQWAQFARRSTSQENMVRNFELASGFDVAPLLPAIRARTLIIRDARGSFGSLETSQLLASGVKGARLVQIEEEGARGVYDSEATTHAILEFLGDPVDEPSAALAGADVHTILFTDMEGSTTLADRLGDAAAQEVRRTHNEIVRAALVATRGNEIKHTGDGIMASFSAASAALDAAIAIQRGVAKHQQTQPNSPLAVYVGLNAGEPIAEDDDLFGTSINLAARICDHAEAGQILAANVVRELAAGKDFLFSDLGETELRGFEDPVKLWELRWQEDA